MTGNVEAEKALRGVLEELDKRFEPLRNEKEVAEWQAYIEGTPESYHKAEQARLALYMAQSEPLIFQELGERLADPGIQDMLLRRWATLLRLELAKNRLPEDAHSELLAKETELLSIYNTFRPEVDGVPVPMSRIHEILRTSKNVKERKEAWEAAKVLGKETAEKLRELVRTRNIAARQLGFPDYYRMYLEVQEIDEARLFSLLGQFASMSEDSFRRLKAKLDRVLADRYNMEAVDLAPWHYSDPCFREMPPVSGANLDDLFKDYPVMDWIRQYFNGVGLSVDQIIPKSDLEDRAGKFPYAQVADLNRKGDVRVLLNLDGSVESATTALQKFGQALYMMNMSEELPYTLRKPSHACMAEASAMFFQRQTRDIEWLIEMFNLTGPQIREIETAVRQEAMMNMAINSRWMLVMIHFERGLYRDPDHDQQQRWWDLVERFQLVRSPEDRTEENDWACMHHFALQPVYYQNYLLGHWIASQMHYKIVDDLKLESPVVYKDLPAVGQWLKENMYSHGAFWEYNEFTRNITGTSPSPKQFIQQYFTGL